MATGRLRVGSLEVNAKEYPPVGFIYFQLAGKATPADLFGVGTWSNISSSYPGEFFRSEGGAAGVFGSAQQASDNLAHTHTHYATGTNNFSYGPPARGNADLAGAWYTTSSSGGTEARPINRTIRVWERTA